MIIDSIKSAIENIKERIRNPFTERNSTPFAGAFIIALVLYNWQLFFSLVSFDSGEKRINRIDIIQQYLNEMNWLRRLFYPVVIAFSSIVFFYIFNTLSLGITTFFNRWGKATILYLTDRSKIITRGELEQNMNKMNTLRNHYEQLKKTFAESQSELEDYKTQILEKEGKLTMAAMESDKAAKEIDRVNLLLHEKNDLYTKALGLIEEERKNSEILKKISVEKEQQYINYSIAKEHEFYADFYNQNYDAAENDLDNLAKTTGNSENESKYLYYRACVAFMQKDYRGASSLLNEAFVKEKDKKDTNTHLRILDIMISIEYERIDKASSSIEALRKYIARKGKTTEFTQRDIFILRLLRELEKNGFKYDADDVAITEMIKQLSDKKSSIAWKYFSEELIPFHKWLISRAV